MGQINKEAIHRYRQRKILKLLEETGNASSESMAQKFGVSRGRIIQDISELRSQGHPIQTGAMTTENGMYVVTFELPEGYHCEA